MKEFKLRRLARLHERFLIIDVRNRSEYARGRIPGSRNYPLDELRRDAADESGRYYSTPCTS
ncbi:MAG: rhodanese-like domain-containing protein [Armatimonadetes bacterium]|nr:rhodanese-like domain-containing protein [Armatimonadota bacterium]